MGNVEAKLELNLCGRMRSDEGLDERVSEETLELLQVVLAQWAQTQARSEKGKRLGGRAVHR
jgi:hypothetical protein